MAETEQTPVKVRPLEWVKVSNSIWDSNPPTGGLYRVRLKDGTWTAFVYGGSFRADRETEIEAKSAAQAHYDASILSTIEVVNSHAAMVEALQSVASAFSPADYREGAMERRLGDEARAALALSQGEQL